MSEEILAYVTIGHSTKLVMKPETLSEFIRSLAGVECSFESTYRSGPGTVYKASELDIHLDIQLMSRARVEERKLEASLEGDST